MKHGIIWCAHCHQPHPLGTKICPGCARSFDRRLTKTPKHPLEGTVLAGKWVLTRLIGSGGAGDVFDAEDTHLRRAAAVKIVRQASSEAADRLEREALLVAAVRHPNICDVYDVGRLPDGRPFVVLERLYGEPLSGVIRSAHETMTLDTIVDLFAQLLSAMHAAHGAQIVHRDLSPKNIFLVDRVGLPPLLKVVDFGFAKDLSGGRVPTTTLPRRRIGTVAYMSPEQLRAGPIDRRSDIFAIGVMLHEALGGQHPFAASSFMQLQLNILEQDPVSLTELRSDVSHRGADAVLRALAKDAADRWPNALAMQNELRRAFPSRLRPLSSAPISAEPPSSSTDSLRSSR